MSLRQETDDVTTVGDHGRKTAMLGGQFALCEDLLCKGGHEGTQEDA